MFGKQQKNEPDMQYFTIYDTKAGAYRDPILTLNKLVILRELHNMMLKKDPENQLFSNAEDFQVFKIGDYYRKTGTIESCNPEHICNLHEVKASALSSGAL